MPVVNVNLLVDDKTYAGIKTGVLELCGMAKNVDNKRVEKHIPAVADAAKEGASKAIDFIRLHKKGTLIVGGVIILGGAVVGTVGYITSLDKRKRERQFAEDLQVYLDAAREGKLTIEILDALINSLDQLSNEDPSKAVNLKITASQFSDLIHSIFDYTIRLAEANNMSPVLISKPKILKKKNYSDLQYYLNMQRSIFEQAA
ncbi:hypothetical protein DW745_02845 [Ruminococcus sp. AM28-29LB]|jgi:hypothetical protein|nr:MULTISPECIES: hypothetical protein [Ruminococcus]RGH89539.1 hypothetical protein DW745_02845 [Ruminococcus sp. AM28-29LB]